MIDFADVVVGLSYGDEGKGKVTSFLAKENYDAVARWAGGDNAGHTVYVNGKKYATHLIPSGVFYGKLSIIGPGCVLHPESFKKELNYLSESGFDTALVKVSPRCHIVLDKYIEKDKQELAGKLGTTSRGIAPVYAAKAARTGVLAKNVLEDKYLWDEELKGRLLCEGAQGMWLDINYGNYPYVTSSETLPYAACSLGFPPQLIRRVYGVAKCYDTRSGEDPDFPISLLEDAELKEVADLGKEYGVTTGRRRKVNWLNLTKLVKAINITGTTELILNKYDILKQLNKYKLYLDEELIELNTLDEFKEFIENEAKENCPLLNEIRFSGSPEEI